MAKVAALTIGINYFGQSGELRGCVNDSHNWLELIRERHPVLVHECQMIDTLPASSPLHPSRANIERELAQLVSLARSGAIHSILFHYSGHGGNLRDQKGRRVVQRRRRRRRHGEEPDGRDETILPADWRSAGEIRDDHFLNGFLHRLPKHVQVMALMDSCHSGTVMDMHYRFKPVGRTKLRAYQENRRAVKKQYHMMLAGCVDKSYSYDVVDPKLGPCGAMTRAFIEAIRGNPRPLAGPILRQMRANIKRYRLPQVPQLSANYRTSHTSRVPVI